QSRNFVPFGKIYKNQRGLTPKVRFLADFWVSPFFFYLFFPITNPFIMNKRGAYSYYGPIIAAEQDRR
ncbi:hypothetical protein, partial [Geobacillus sp. WSUCF-018B]|uniref:hypothetical protein n=1 Tax=Geobacillus sp. WSUCF-018B TaxID=2055939 RepID=UPI000CC04660